MKARSRGGRRSRSHIAALLAVRWKTIFQTERPLENGPCAALTPLSCRARLAHGNASLCFAMLHLLPLHSGRFGGGAWNLASLSRSFVWIDVKVSLRY